VERVEAMAEQIGALPAVKSVGRDDGHLKIETHRFQEALMAILEISNQLDVRITSLEKWEPNLESVFLHLTGKRLRE
jgi:ABC-2 type transport system ATP-binding protein